MATAKDVAPSWPDVRRCPRAKRSLTHLDTVFPRITIPPLPPPAADASWLTGAGGVRLYASARLPGVESVGVIYFVLGPEIGSAELYPRFADAARRAGFVTAVLHPRGTGYSDGLRGDIDDYELFLGDVEQGLECLRQRFPTKPIFLFGHSAGAALALELAARSSRIAGLIVVNPAYRVIYSEGMGPSFINYVAYAWNFLFRRSALTVDMNSAPSRVRDAADRAEAEAMQRDPLVVRYFSLRYLVAQKHVMDRCATNASLTDAPILLVQGARDSLVDPTRNDEILAAARTTDKAKLVATLGAHGSTAVETMVDDILAWLQKHASPADGLRPQTINHTTSIIGAAITPTQKIVCPAIHE
ncbi:MAG: alpha/beta fold hydrolase [Vicinamibacterales bacterium]